MNGVGCDGAQHAIEPRVRTHRQPDAGIRGCGNGAKCLGRDQRDPMADGFQVLDRIGQCGNDSVDLRSPRVGNDGELHATLFFANAAASADSGTSEYFSSAQCSNCKVPSLVSTRAVQLSTQSPSLQYRTLFICLICAW